MADLGVDAYRFSVAWPRDPARRHGPGQPGRARPSTTGSSTRCSTRGIAPVATLFHWDLPQALQDRGGWLDRDTAHRFAEYAGTGRRRRSATGCGCGSRSTSRSCTCRSGYALGTHAPGQQLLFDAVPGRAPPAARPRARGRRAARPAPSARSRSPTTTPPPGPVSGCAAPTGPPPTAYDALHNRLFTDPLLGRGYPARGTIDLRASSRDGDLDVIAAPIDALGVNYYNPTGVRAPPRTAARCRSSSCRSRATRPPRSAGRWCRTGCASCSSTLQRPVRRRAAADLHHRERLRVRRRARRRTAACDDPDRIAYLDGHLARRPRGAMADGRRRARLLRLVACWTTSSGPRGSPSGSGWSTSTSTRRRRTPKSSYHWYRERIRDHR